MSSCVEGQWQGRRRRLTSNRRRDGGGEEEHDGCEGELHFERWVGSKGSGDGAGGDFLEWICRCGALLERARSSGDGKERLGTVVRSKKSSKEENGLFDETWLATALENLCIEDGREKGRRMLGGGRGVGFCMPPRLPLHARNSSLVARASKHCSRTAFTASGLPLPETGPS